MASNSTTSNEPLLRHLQPPVPRENPAALTKQLMQVTSLFSDMAHALVDMAPRNAERSVALRKLIEAKDAALRAVAEEVLQPLESASSS